MDKIKEMVLKEIENITNGERFISKEQLEEIELVPYLYLENCGISGTSRGILYTLYLMDKEGTKTNIELTELIVIY